jgi:hypothetical protein
VKAKFVALAVDGRVVNDFNDAETNFLKEPTICVANGASGVAYVVGASGIRVHLCSVGNPDKKTLQMGLEKALEKWSALPLAERKPGAVQVGEKPAVDPKRALQSPPEGSLIVHVYNRQFGRTAKGELRYTEPEDYVPWMRTTGWGTARVREPADDYMWVTRPEWQALMPRNPQKGQRVKIPTTFVERIIRFHLDPGHGMCEWQNFVFLQATPSVVQLTLTVEEVATGEVRMRLEGFANLRNERTPEKGGLIVYEPRLLGQLAYDPARKVFTRFDIVALGDVTGQPADENPVGSRPGTNPLGVAFELVVNPKPADFVCPRGQRDMFQNQPFGGLGSDYYLGLKRFK